MKGDKAKCFHFLDREERRYGKESLKSLYRVELSDHNLHVMCSD